MAKRDYKMISIQSDSEFNTLLMMYDKEWKTFFEYTMWRLREARKKYKTDLILACQESGLFQSNNHITVNTLFRLIENSVTIENQMWTSQEYKCIYLDVLWNRELATVRSVSDLQRLKKKLDNNFREVGYVETCQILVSPSGWLNLSPCIRNTTVAIKKDLILNEVNSFTLTLRDALNRRVEQFGESFTYDLDVTIKNLKGNSVYLTIDDEKNGIYNISFLPIILNSYYMFIKINSIPIPGNPFHLSVVDHSNKNRNPITIGEMGTGFGQFHKPWGVCCDSYGRIYVADRCNHRIQVFNEKGNFIYKFGKRGENLEEFNRPCGITIDSYQRIIVADKDNHRIQILQSNGKYINHFGRYESEEENLLYPWDVSVDNYDRIVVTEEKKKRIRLFNDKGDRLAECIFNSEMGLGFPRGISSIPDGSFITTDFQNHKLVLLNSQLEIISIIGTCGGETEEICRPQGIAVNSDGLIAVSDNKNKRIKIYKGSRPQKIITNNFENIQGIAFHPNGSLIVTDSSKNTLTIFTCDKNIYPSDEYFADSEWIG